MNVEGLGAPVRKRALIVIPADLPGGAEKLANLVARTLSRRPGWEVKFVSLASRSYRFYLKDVPKNVVVAYGDGAGRLGSEIQLMPHLMSQKYDFVFSTHIRINAFLSIARRVGILRCVRLVTRESTVIADRYSGPRLCAYKLAYFGYRGQDAIVVQTQYMAEKVARYLPGNHRGKVQLIENPIDLRGVRESVSEVSEVEFPGEADPEMTIVWCGRLIDVKNPLAAVDVLTELHRHGMEFNLCLIGRGHLELAIREHAIASGVGDNVFLLGQLSNPYPVFAKAKYGLVTSLTEGFPNVLLEMLASGVKNVITTPCTSGISEMPGVSVSSGFAAEDVARAFIFQAEEDEIPKVEIRSMLSKRRPEKYVDSLLGVFQCGESEYF